MFRLIAATFLVLSSVLVPAGVVAQEGTFCALGQAPGYVFGFAELRSQVGDAMGDPLTCEFPDSNGTGDVHQRTSTGLAFYRKSTNTPTFTNGFEHWGLTADGLVYWTGDSIDPPGVEPPPLPPSPPTPEARVVDIPPFSSSAQCNAWVSVNRPLLNDESASAVSAYCAELRLAEVQQQVPTPTATPAATATPTPTPAPTEADIAARLGPSTVQIITDLGFGSGVKVAEGVLTNHHVIEGAKSIKVVTADGRTATARLLRSDAYADLALLEVSLALPAVEMVAARDQRQGDPVLVLGYPEPMAIGSAGATLSRGIISAVRDSIPRPGVLVVQTDATMNPGNSGGPMVNMQGKLIGLATYSVQDTTGLNFAVSTETIKGFLAKPASIAPSPTPAVPIYTGSPANIAPELADFSSGWVQTGSDWSPDRTLYSVSFESGYGFTWLGVGVVVGVAPTIADAQAVYMDATRKPADGFTQLVPAPRVGDDSYAQRSSGVASLTVLARNVVLGVTIAAANSSRVSLDLPTEIARDMVNGVNALAR